MGKHKEIKAKITGLLLCGLNIYHFFLKKKTLKSIHTCMNLHVDLVAFI